MNLQLDALLQIAALKLLMASRRWIALRVLSHARTRQHSVDLFHLTK